MDRLYYSFNINLPDNNDKQYKGFGTPYVDFIAFKNQKHDLTITLEGAFSEWSIENTVCSGKIKDLEISVESPDEKSKYDTHGYVPMKEEYFELLKDSELNEIGLDEGMYEFSNPLIAKNLEVEINFMDTEMNFSKEGYISLEEYGDPSLKNINNSEETKIMEEEQLCQIG